MSSASTSGDTTSSNGTQISVVSPTYRRPNEVVGLLESLVDQERLPCQVIAFDGSDARDDQAERAIRAVIESLPFSVRYLRTGRGTAVQRNAGIECARGDFVAFLDDDVRPGPHFLAALLEVFELDTAHEVGGVVGYRTNVSFRAEESQRWRWYRRLHLLTTYIPGKYDFRVGYPINNNMQQPFSGTRSVDFMTTACALWRREVFDDGLRFDPFFTDYGVLEDAHFSLRAGKRWRLLQCGDASCRELSAAGGRVDAWQIGYKCVVNYYYVFQTVAGPLSSRQRIRFWTFQAFELGRILASALRRRRRRDLREAGGRLAGFVAVARGATAVHC